MQLLEIAIVRLLYIGMPLTNAVHVTFDLDSSAYFSTSNLILTCRVDQDVLINSATFKRDQVTQIGIYDPTSTCTPTKFFPTDLHNYSTSCMGLRNLTLTKYGVNKTEEQGRVWQCTFISNPGGPCISTSPCVSPNITVPLETTTTSTTASSPPCELELGLGLGLGSGIPCVMVFIVVIFMYKGYTYAYRFGLLIGLGLGITFQVSWIIIASLISKGNKCKLELGLGLGLGSGIPCVITFSVAVIFMYKGGKLVQQLCDFPNCQTCGYHNEIWDKLHNKSEKGNPSRVDSVNGIRDGLFIASVIGIIVVFLIYKTPEEEPTEPTGKKKKTKIKGQPGVHTRTQNKVEPKATIKGTNDKHQPFPLVDTGFEDTPKIHPQTPSPRNSDTLGQSNETHHPKMLPPLEDASKEHKKKRKKKKKNGQMNDGNSEKDMV